MPRDFDPLKSVIASLTSQNNADENEVEVNRIHAILHPDCLEKLVAAFDYSPPEDRMELPRFFSDQTDDQSPPGPRSAPTDLSAEELAELSDMLAEQSERRRRSPTAVIRIMVDGVERGRLIPVEQSSVSFSAEEDAEIIEVKTTDSGGDLLLATHLLASFREDAHDATIVSSIRLEGGQELALSITRRQIVANAGADFLVTFGYRETNLRRAARLWWQRLNLRSSHEQSPRTLWGGRHVLVGSVLVICLVSLLGYVALRSRQTNEPSSVHIAQAIPVPSIPAEVPQSPEPRPAQRVKSDKSTTPKASSSPAEEDDATRSGNVVPNLSLRDVKKIYIEIRGGPGLDGLNERLNSSGVAAVTNANDADAALKIVITQTGVSARLVNARGIVLWPKTGARRYSGESSKVVSEIIKDLQVAFRK